MQVHDPRAGLGDRGLGHDERLAVARVEAHRDVTRQLDVLALVVADGDAVGVVQEDVGRHQGRVGEQAGGDELAGVARGLVLELRHALQLADARGALEQPVELGVLGDMALHEDRAHVRVESAATSIVAIASVLARSSAGSWGSVREWRSTTQ